MDAPLAPSSLFGDAVSSIIDRYKEARKQAATFQRFLPRRSIALGLLGWSSPSRVPPPHTGRLKNRAFPLALPCSRTEVCNALSRGLLRQSPIWGSCFSLGSPLRSGPDIFKSWTAEGGPYWGRAGAPHYTESVSPQRPHEIVLPTLPVFQGGSGLKRGCLSVLSTRERSGAESLATPLRVSRAASCSKHTRSQSRETGSISILFSSVETTAKCISVGPSECRKRLSHSVRRSATAFQRFFSHISEPRAGSGIKTRGEHSLEEGGHRGGPSSRQRGSIAGTSLFQRRMGDWVRI